MLIKKAKGKAPKVIIAIRKDGSRFVTFPRGDTLQEVRNKARKGKYFGDI